MRRVYFNEYNIPMGNAVYLPYVSGLLQAYAEMFPIVRDNYEFMPFIYKRDTPDNIVKLHKNPDVVCFSVCIWNEQLCLEVARRLKKKYPLCRIVFGGPQVTEQPSFVDHVIRQEGERKFVSVLTSGLPVPLELDDFPSPYVKGLYDDIVKDGSTDYQSIIETSRGCPFSCAFCYWGQGLDEKKIKFHSLKYVKEEAEWIGRNKIKYVFIADANFGMYKQDIEVAKIYAEVKKKYGYPEKVRVCYGKNKEDNVFDTAKVLFDAGLAKAITLSKQSTTPVVLENIKRKNIRDTDALERRYKRAGMSTYSELILGLPGETAESFKRCVDSTAKRCDKLFIYHCTLLPNTAMADPEYIRKHKIRSVRVPLAEIHCEVRPKGYVTEYENIVISTATMLQLEWIDCAVYSWKTQLRYVFGIKHISYEENSFLYDVAYGIVNGKPRGRHEAKFGNIYWEPEELVFLRETYKDGDPVEYARKHVLYGRKGNDGLINTNTGN